MSRSGRMPLRSWLVIAMAAMVLVPLLSWFGVITVLRGPGKTHPAPWDRRSSEALTDALDLIRARPADWPEPAFQAELASILERGRYSATLFGPDGRAIYQQGSAYDVKVEQTNGVRTQVVSSSGDRTHVGTVTGANGRVLGSFILVRPAQDPMVPLFLVTGLGAATLALILLVRQMGRSLNTPLKALAEATHRINQGDLAFSLPRSGVRELDELGQAFGAMRDGLKKSIERQAELEAERRFFIAAVAHDLRTPLSSVRGYLEGLHDDVARSPDQVRRYVAVALEKARALERLIESLFVYARSEYLDQPPQREELEVGEILSAEAAGVRPHAAAKEITLVLDGQAESCLVKADRQMLIRIVDNLLDNGLRHTPSGGRVTLGWRNEGDQCRLWVLDSGPGLSPDELERVFTPHYRGDAARSSRTGGAGLGLAIARRLVEAHGGSIAAANQGGALFTVLLPRETDQE